MKIFIILFFILSFSSNAQNVTMAKAFYKKAQQEYENKNYQEVINLLEKTKENLDGETNPDIIYLEAKSRYENDLNVYKAKTLFNQFLNDADENDGRINEVSNILVDIETFKNHFKNGNRKVKTTFNENNKIIQYFYPNGNDEWTETYNKNNILIKKYLSDVSGDYLRGEIYDEEGKFKYAIYFSNNKVRAVIWGNGNRFKLFDENEKFVQRYCLENQDITNPITCSFYSLKSFDDHDNYESYYEKAEGSYDKVGVYINEFHDEPLIKPSILMNRHRNFKLGMVKSLRYDAYEFNGLSNRYYTYVVHFDKKGIPTKKERFKNGKLKQTYKYNKELLYFEKQ